MLRKLRSLLSSIIVRKGRMEQVVQRNWNRIENDNHQEAPAFIAAIQNLTPATQSTLLGLAFALACAYRKFAVVRY